MRGGCTGALDGGVGCWATREELGEAYWDGETSERWVGLRSRTGVFCTLCGIMFEE